MLFWFLNILNFFPFFLGFESRSSHKSRFIEPLMGCQSSGLMDAKFEFMYVALQYWKDAESESANERIRALWFCLVEVLFLFLGIFDFFFFFLLIERKLWKDWKCLT